MNKTIFAAGLLSLVSLAGADTLTLKNGTSVEGTYLGGTAREVRMEIGDRIQTFSLDSVSSLQFGRGQGMDNSSRQDRQQPQDRPRILRPDSDSPQGGFSTPQAGPANLELQAGTQMTVRMIDAVDSQVAHLGDTFRASIDEPVTVNGQAVIPRGADVVAKLVEAQQSGKITGRTVLKLALVSVRVGDRTVDITTDDIIKESSSRGARSGKVIGGTAVLGAIIGGIAGGGAGAAIGAGSGAAVGTGAEAISKNQRVKVPSETRLVFTLSYAVRI